MPDSCKYPLKSLRGRIRFLLFTILRGAAHIVPHPLRQLLRLKSCPTSNYDDRIPDHLRREPTCHVCLPLGCSFSRNPYVPSGRPNRRTHLKSAVSVCRRVTSGEQRKETNGFGKLRCRCFSGSSILQQPAALTVLVRLCVRARRDGIQGVAVRMLQENTARTSACLQVLLNCVMFSDGKITF